MCLLKIQLALQQLTARQGSSQYENKTHALILKEILTSGDCLAFQGK